jgi:pimeloyl-ACP methyl ester carboxylesterase
MTVMDTSSYIDEGAHSRTVLLIHGHPFNRTMWAPQVEMLKTRRRVVVPDLRGYGRSGLPVERETSLETFASDSLALIDALHVRTFALGGLSMGGQIALEIYRQAPERIEGLLLADTFAGLDTAERRQLRFTAADRLEREGIQSYAHEELPKMIAPANAQQTRDLVTHVMEMMTTTSPAGAAAALRGRARRRDYLPLLRDVRVPTVVVVGREDAYTPVSFAEELRDHIPGARLEVIEGAGHMPNLERPSEFNHVVEEWLRLVDLKSAISARS